MDYEKFISAIQEQIRNYLPKPYQNVEMSVRSAKKNNDTERLALVLHRPGETISPQIYLE